MTSIDGRQVSLPAAGKPTAVFFFSVGCGECVGGVRSLGEAAASAHFPGGHNEGWPDAFKNMMLSFYQAVRAGEMPPASSRRFASLYEGADVMYIIAAIVKSHQQQRWISVAQ